VVADGFTFMEPLVEVDVNVPGVMAIEVAPVADQLSVLAEPGFTDVGLAAKEDMVGAEPVPEDEPDVPPQCRNVADANIIRGSSRSRFGCQRATRRLTVSRVMMLRFDIRNPVVYRGASTCFEIFSSGIHDVV
jgi:hypothetical protein